MGQATENNNGKDKYCSSYIVYVYIPRFKDDLAGGIVRSRCAHVKLSWRMHTYSHLVHKLAAFL